jgi:hypothetical protein
MKNFIVAFLLLFIGSIIYANISDNNGKKITDELTLNVKIHPEKQIIVSDDTKETNLLLSKIADTYINEENLKSSYYKSYEDYLNSKNINTLLKYTNTSIIDFINKTKKEYKVIGLTQLTYPLLAIISIFMIIIANTRGWKSDWLFTLIFIGLLITTALTLPTTIKYIFYNESEAIKALISLSG